MNDKVKIVIEIDKKIYEHACDGVIKFVTAEMDVEIEKAIKNGTPLDKIKDKILDYNVRQHISGSESYLIGFAAGMDKSAELLEST